MVLPCFSVLFYRLLITISLVPLTLFPCTYLEYRTIALLPVHGLSSLLRHTLAVRDAVQIFLLSTNLLHVIY